MQKKLLTFIIAIFVVAIPRGYSVIGELDTVNWRSWVERDCFARGQFDYPSLTNPALLELLCNIKHLGMSLGQRPNWNFTIHSDGRPRLSQHYTYNAVDFHLSDYGSLNEIETLKEYKKDLNAMLLTLSLLQVEGVVGLGIYPNQNNPFFHLDLRGERARWGRVEDSGSNYVTFIDAIDWIDNKLR